MYKVIAIDKTGTEEYNSKPVDKVIDAFVILNKDALLTQSALIHKRVLKSVNPSILGTIQFNLFDKDDNYIGIACIQEVE